MTDAEKLERRELSQDRAALVSHEDPHIKVEKVADDEAVVLLMLMYINRWSFRDSGTECVSRACLG